MRRKDFFTLTKKKKEKRMIIDAQSISSLTIIKKIVSTPLFRELLNIPFLAAKFCTDLLFTKRLSRFVQQICRTVRAIKVQIDFVLEEISLKKNFFNIFHHFSN